MGSSRRLLEIEMSTAENFCLLPGGGRRLSAFALTV